MSLPPTNISCTRCDFSHSIFHAPIVLKCQLDNNEVISYHRVTAWCYDCDTIRDAEALPTLGELQAELVEKRGSGVKGFVKRFSADFKEKVTEIENKLHWLRQRTSPSRCLHCSSTNISLLDFAADPEGNVTAQGFKHTCGGLLMLKKDSSGIRYHIALQVIWMDQEGRIIPEASQ